MVKLVWKVPGQAPLAFPLRQERVSVGRDAGNDIRLPEPAVSSRHATIIRKAGRVVLHDLKSSNGTWVNGARIDNQELVHGDMVAFGRVVMSFVDEDMEAPPPPPKPEPNSRIVRVIDTTYTFQRIEPQMDKVQGRKVKACWETFLDENDKSSRAVVNTFEDGACGPWAVTGVFTDFAGAAAVEVVVRSMQRHFVFTTKKDAKVRKLLAGFGLPLMTVLGVFIGYIMGVLH